MRKKDCVNAFMYCDLHTIFKTRHEKIHIVQKDTLNKKHAQKLLVSFKLYFIQDIIQVACVRIVLPS